MNRVLTALGAVPAAADHELLARFVGDRDEAAFAELVRRLGPVVWGACFRMLNSRQDAEDAFQAAFLVLVRRAATIRPDTPLGPWLYKVAALTARNVRRGNRRRAVVSGPLEHDVPAPASAVPKSDVDRALLALPDRERAAVVLCHLNGYSRREAAARLGCPEGTLSARLNRARTRLRAALGAELPATLAVALPVGLAHATARAAAVYTFSALAAPGLSPTVARLTDGALRMFWLKKATAAASFALLLGAGVLALGLTGRPEHAARATEPPAKAAPDADKFELRDRMLKFNAEQREAQRQREAAEELGGALGIVVTEGGRGLGWGKPPYTVREVVNGKVGEVQCYELDILEHYLRRVAADPNGPKSIRFYVDRNWSHDQVHKLFAACASAGFKKGRFILPEAPLLLTPGKDGQPDQVERGEKETDIDLAKYARPKK